MESYTNKMIAPIIVSRIIILYYVLYFFLLLASLNGIWKYVFGTIPIALSVLIIKVCNERIKEIKEDEEDDIS